MKRALPTRTIAIDYGLKRIGIAVSDESGLIASFLPIFETKKSLGATAQALTSRLEEHQKSLGYTLSEIVVGLPLHLSGKKSPLSDEVLSFVSELKKLLNCPIVTWDERLTSVQADRSMKEASLSRKQRAHAADSVAAMLILQSYLDSKRECV